MPSAPSRFEVEHLRRLMLKASVEAAQLDERVDQARKDDSLWPALHHWSDAAESLEEAVERARPELQQDGTPKEQIDRIRERLGGLEQRSKRFDLDYDLDFCVDAWTSLGHELAQLSGRRRDPLVRLLELRKPAIDQTTAMLSEAQRHEGLLQQQHREVLELQKEHDRAREKYERLRQAWLTAQRDCEAAEQQKAAAAPPQQYEVKKPPMPDLRRLTHGRLAPVIVRLPASTPVVRNLPSKPIPPLPPGKPDLRKPQPAGHRAARYGKGDLPRLLERNHQQRDVVAARVEKTLSHLATAPHRTLTDSTTGELRAHLARMDAILSRLRGAARHEVLEGAHAVGSIIQRMNSVAARAGGGGHSAEIRKHIEDRRAQLHRIAQAQLSSELKKRSDSGLGALSLKPQPIRGALGTTAILSGGLHALGAAHPAGFAPPGVAPRESHPLAGLQVSGTPLRELAAKAELRQKQLAARARKGPVPAQATAAALLGAFREHPKAAGFAAHLAPGGALRELCETAQRGHGLPIGQAAQHYLASRGSSHLWNAVTTFNTLVSEGHRPRFSFGSWLKKNVSDQVSHALHGVSQTVTRATDTVAGLAGAARQGISSFANRASEMGVRAAAQVGRAVARGATSVARGGLQAAQHIGRSTLGLVRHAGHALAHVAAGGLHAVRGAATWAQRKAGGAAHGLGERVHSGLEWTRKTGVVGAVGTGLRKGLSFLKTAAQHTPLGYAVKKGYGFVKAGGLSKVWNATKHVAGQAWTGLKTAYDTTSKFLQSPAGQLLVTGLSLAASFIPGGIVVKAVIGAGIGAMQAISEGKDWKAVLASAAGGALTGAIPFLKIGPLAKIGIGALQGGITAVASGGSLKDALNGAAGGALDSFDPGAFHALKKLKSFTTAEKLLKGKAMADPRARKTLAALEKLGSKGVKGGIWVSGKAARAQHALDKVVRAGDQIHSVLSEVHTLAPGLADVVGDNAAGHFVGRLGDWAGQGDDRLHRALGYGHAASDTLSKYHGYLDKGLAYAGVKDPGKAYEKMMARRDLRAGKKGALEHLARLKLEDHRRKHPELHLAEATRRRRHPRSERTALEKAVTRGQDLVRKGRRVAQGVHDGLGKVHDVVEKGLSGAEKVQSGLEKAIAVARQGADVLGEDSEFGRYLTRVADRADRIHDHLETGIGVAQDFNRKVGATHEAIEKIPGVHKDGEPEPLTYLDGRRTPRKSPHDVAPPKASAWERIGSVSRQVQKFETEYGKSQRKIQESLHKGQANAASIELMRLGSRCEEIALSIREAKTLAKGNEKYEKEIAFYEEWHRATKAKLHTRIADTKGLGAQVAVSGFGIAESTHPDIFENTRAIYAVRTKVESFGAALRDPDAKAQVAKVLAEAKKAKRDLEALKAKYRKDKAAHDFLTGGGMQDKLIDEAMRKLEASAQPVKPAKHGLAAIEKYKKQAIKAGKRIDSGLTTAERALHKGIGAGKKIDSGLEKVASVAGQVSQILGEDSALGELVHQVGAGAGKGHEKLHQALDMAQTGKKFLHKGHEIFRQGLEAAQGHHAKQIEKVHGKKPVHADHKEGALEHALHEGQHLGHDAGALWKEGKRFVHDVRGAVHGGWELVKGLFGGGDHPQAEVNPAQAVQNALQWVTAFGKQITAAIRQIERLMHAGRTKEAADRVHALRAMSEQTRVEVDRAVQAAANDPQLAKQAASARKHYLEIRAHLSQFVKGLHGLDAGPEPAHDRRHAPSGRRGHAHHDPVGELIDGILDGNDGRIHVDKGAARGDVPVDDLQEVDPAALETWLGSGEGVKLFSEVFGAFIPAEGALVVHHRRGRPGGRADVHPPHAQPSHRGFFARVFDGLEGFADRIAGWARKGSSLLGKGMHYAETGMHGLSQVESGAEKVQGYAGQAEGFLEKMGLHTLAGYAGKVGGAAGWVDDEAKAAHGGLKKADHWMGEGKSALGKFGGLVNLFKASKSGDGIDGKLSPQKVALGSAFDEPRRLDVTTLSKMQSFLGDDFSGVRVHTGPGAAEVTRRFNAEAVTVKDHIFFAPGRFNPTTVEGQKLIAHELTHVLQKGRANLDVRTAEGEALHAEHSYGHGPQMETLNLRRPEPGFRLASDGTAASSGIHTAKRTRSRGHEAGAKDELPDGDELLEEISGRVYDLLMEELENAFESR